MAAASSPCGPPNCSSMSVARSGSGRATRTVYIRRLLWMNMGISVGAWQGCGGSALRGDAFGGLAGEEREDHGLMVLQQPLRHRLLLGEDPAADRGDVLVAGLARGDHQRAVR